VQIKVPNFMQRYWGSFSGQSAHRLFAVSLPIARSICSGVSAFFFFNRFAARAVELAWENDMVLFEGKGPPTTLE